jgi:hypothetical protein
VGKTMISRECASAEAEHCIEREVEDIIGLRLVVKHWVCYYETHTCSWWSEVILKLPLCSARVLYGLNCRQ